MSIPQLQRNPLNPHLIKHVKNTIVFLTQKVANYDNFTIASYKQEFRMNHFYREAANENKKLKETKSMNILFILD